MATKKKCIFCGGAIKEIEKYLYNCKKCEHVYFDWTEIVPPIKCNECGAGPGDKTRIPYLWEDYTSIDEMKEIVEEGRYRCSCCGEPITIGRERTYTRIVDPIVGKGEAEAALKLCKNDKPNKHAKSIDIKWECVDKDTLCRYIKGALDIEKNLYAMETRLEELFVFKQSKERNAKESYEVLETEMNERKNEIEIEYESELEKIKHDKFSLKEKKYPKQPEDPGEFSKEYPVKQPYKKAGIFNKKKIMQENMEIDVAYENAIREYNQEKALFDELKAKYIELKEVFDDKYNEVEEYNKDIRKQIDKKRKEAKKEIIKQRDKKLEEYEIALKNGEWTTIAIFEDKIISEEINTILEKYKEMYSLRQEYYSIGKIYEKYRNLPALSMICEYLESGRCERLEGADGAYNLYESELRANIIIDKLDTVIEKLEEIKRAQYLLCSMIDDVHQDLTRIDDKMQKACAYLDKMEGHTARLVKNSEIIAKNTALTAYYSEKTLYYSKMTAHITMADFMGI